MFRKYYCYLIKIQFLGYRFHGWQKQPKTKTLHSEIDRTLRYVLKDHKFKTLAAGRTDAKVSANFFALELFLENQPLNNNKLFIDDFNNNLPQDIRVMSVEEVSPDFNIIKDSKIKEYHYLFSSGQKSHPFSAPFISTFKEELNLNLMKKGASLFQGEHNFKAYCYKPKENGLFLRKVEKAKIIKNNIYKANFFPKNSYIFKVVGKGFGRHQIRLMMGVLVKLGRGEVNLTSISESLKPDSNYSEEYIAPASGLILHSISF